HRDAVLVFRVAGFDLRRPLGLRFLRGNADGKDCGRQKKSKDGTTGERHGGSLLSADRFRTPDAAGHAPGKAPMPAHVTSSLGTAAVRNRTGRNARFAIRAPTSWPPPRGP